MLKRGLASLGMCFSWLLLLVEPICNRCAFRPGAPSPPLRRDCGNSSFILNRCPATLALRLPRPEGTHGCRHGRSLGGIRRRGATRGSRRWTPTAPHGANELAPDRRTRSRRPASSTGIDYTSLMSKDVQKLLERITQTPGICGGRACIRGMRIRVTDILQMMAEGVSQEEILADFPDLEPDDLRACLAFGAKRAGHIQVAA